MNQEKRKIRVKMFECLARLKLVDPFDVIIMSVQVDIDDMMGNFKFK